MLLLFLASFALFSCGYDKEESAGEKIVQDVVKGVVRIKNEYDNYRNNATEKQNESETNDAKKEIIVKEPEDPVSKIMLDRLEKMYDLVDDPLSGNYMKEHFPDLRLIYADENKTMLYYYSELANSTFKLWSRFNKVVAIKEGKRIDFE
ncbi:hypothetical protein GF371_04030 [Candidatus Woesearchaeota archaeon]|nr:hypothetical protein [Candidatus Woesearchaeota archaeon]